MVGEEEEDGEGLADGDGVQAEGLGLLLRKQEKRRNGAGRAYRGGNAHRDSNSDVSSGLATSLSSCVGRSPSSPTVSTLGVLARASTCGSGQFCRFERH